MPLKTLQFYQTHWVFIEFKYIKISQLGGLEGDCANCRGRIFGKQIVWCVTLPLSSNHLLWCLVNQAHAHDSWLLRLIFCLTYLGIILEYEQSGVMKSKSIDLLDLKPSWVELIISKKIKEMFNVKFSKKIKEM